LAGKRTRMKKNGVAAVAQPPSAVGGAGELLRRVLLRGAVWTALIAAVAVGVCLGFGRLAEKVHALDRFDRELVLEWTDLPGWLRLRDNRHILEGLAQRVDLRPQDRLRDPELAERIGQALSAPDVGWIKSVDRVTVQPNGVVSVRCQFRHPSAWVRRGRYCYLIDDTGVRLPGQYVPDDCTGGALLVIDGVQQSAPDVGGAWRGADLAAGLRMAVLLAAKPFRSQVTSVIVENYDGRLDRSRPHIELATDRPGSRVWWGRPPEEEFGTEITATQKVTLLQTLYEQYGRIDMGQPYVNIMTWPDRIGVPAPPAPPPIEKPARARRG
jgi:hypothetical protein